jgi:hypothetical protein
MFPSLTIDQTPFNESRGSLRIFIPNVFLSAMLIGKYYDCGAFFFVTDFTDIYV